MTADLLLSQAVEAFLLARMADSYSRSTIAQYRWGLERFTAHAGDPPLSTVTTATVRAFLAYLQTDYEPTRPSGSAAPLGNASLFAAWKAVRALYKWASPEFGVPNPAASIPAPRTPPQVIVPLTQEEIKRLLKVTDRTRLAQTNERRSFTMPRPTARRDRAIVLLLLDTGLRVSELCRARVGDCDLQAGTLTVRPHGAGIKSRPRVLPLGLACRRALVVYLAGVDSTAPLFRSEQGDELDRSGVRILLVRLGKKAGISHCNPHRFRHTFAIQFLRNGGDVFTLQRMLGHTSLEMVRHYLDLAAADDETAHRRASPVDNWRL